MKTYSEKELKQIEKTIKLGCRELDRMRRPPPMTPAERKEMRAYKAREARALKAVLNAKL